MKRIALFFLLTHAALAATPNPIDVFIRTSTFTNQLRVSGIDFSNSTSVATWRPITNANGTIWLQLLLTGGGGGGSGNVNWYNNGSLIVSSNNANFIAANGLTLTTANKPGTAAFTFSITSGFSNNVINISNAYSDTISNYLGGLIASAATTTDVTTLSNFFRVYINGVSNAIVVVADSHIGTLSNFLASSTTTLSNYLGTSSTTFSNFVFSAILGGDLSGSLGNATVAGIQGVSISGSSSTGGILMRSGGVFIWTNANALVTVGVSTNLPPITWTALGMAIEAPSTAQRDIGIGDEIILGSTNDYVVWRGPMREPWNPTGTSELRLHLVSANTSSASTTVRVACLTPTDISVWPPRATDWPAAVNVTNLAVTLPGAISNAVSTARIPVSIFTNVVTGAQFAVYVGGGGGPTNKFVGQQLFNH